MKNTSPIRAIVTGGAGFIGSHLIDLLLEKEYEVVAIDDLSAGNLENLASAFENKAFRFIQLDIQEKKELALLFKEKDVVFHLAGKADIVPSIEYPTQYFDVNVGGTLNVMEGARKANVSKVIYAASSSCYGICNEIPTPESASIEPQYPYALTKYQGEQLVMHWHKVYQLACVSLRLFNVYGPRSRTTGAYGAVLGTFLAQKLSGKPLTVVGDGEQKRDFIYVSDVAQAFLHAAQSKVSGAIYNVGSGQSHSINTLVSLLDCKKITIPKRPGEPDCTFADIQRITEELAWHPQVTFEEGISCVMKNINLWKEAPVWTVDKIEQATKTWFNYLGKDIANSN